MPKKLVLSFSIVLIFIIFLTVYFFVTYNKSATVYRRDTLSPFKTYDDGGKACYSGADCKSKLCISDDNYETIRQYIKDGQVDVESLPEPFGFCSAEDYHPCRMPFAIDENSKVKTTAFCN